MSRETHTHPTEEELHALADGTIAADARLEVARHVERCVDCAGGVARVRALLAAVAEVPRIIEPPVDLWPAIQRHVAMPRATRTGARRSWPSMAWLAAAAVVLVTVTAVITWRVTERRARAIPPSVAVDPSPGPIRPVSEYDRLDRELAALLASHRKVLRPETIATVERNLAVIDQAIAEIRAALADDPANRVLHELLQSSYGQKAALLRQVSRT